MNSLNSLYFPGTTLYSISQYPLFLLFPTIHLLQVAESNIHGNGVRATDSFIKSGFCQLHTPCPLGDDLNRFIHLLDDIKNKTDYASQLSALTLAAMSTQDETKDGSQQEIVASLLNNNLISSDKQKEKKDSALWQARLILAIGEILDTEEEAIARQLAIIKDDEAELFKVLQGKDDDFEEENFLKELSLIRDNINLPNPGNSKNRFQSWCQLYKEGNIPPYDILLTTSIDTADQIFESFERENNRQPSCIGKLSLPAVIGLDEEEAANAAHSFQKENSGLITTFTKNITQLKSSRPVSSDNLDLFFTNFTPSWEQQIETYFPAESFGRIVVSIYSFTGWPCSSIFGTDKMENDNNTCLMAVADIKANNSA